MPVDVLAILPLAIVMVAGPQIVSAIVLATGQDARRNSLAFLAGVALAITVGTMVAFWLFRLVKTSAPAEGKARSGPLSTGWSSRSSYS
jgi:small neutral amino acid transporter SnatA (MarC family)